MVHDGQHVMMPDSYKLCRVCMKYDTVMVAEPAARLVTECNILLISMVQALAAHCMMP
jgi:hypothetical protein